MIVKYPKPSFGDPSPGTILYSTSPLVPLSKSIADSLSKTGVPTGVFSAREISYGMFWN